MIYFINDRCEDRLNKKRWTDIEIRKLRLIADGIDGIQIEGRTKTSIQYKIRALKLKNDRRYDLWTDEEIRCIKERKHIEGRSNRTIERKRISLRLYKREPRFAWTHEHNEILRQARAQGLSAKEIYERQLLPANYSRNAIQKKLCRFGLARKNTKYKKFNQSTKLIFQNFLKENWMGKLPDELAQLWNQAHHAYPVSQKRVIQYLTDLGIKVSCYEMGYIRRLRQFEQLQKMNAAKDNLVFVNEKIRAKRVQMMARRFRDNKDIWTGLQMQVPINMDEEE